MVRVLATDGVQLGANDNSYLWPWYQGTLGPVGSPGSRLLAWPNAITPPMHGKWVTVYAAQNGTDNFNLNPSLAAALGYGHTEALALSAGLPAVDGWFVHKRVNFQSALETTPNEVLFLLSGKLDPTVNQTFYAFGFVEKNTAPTGWFVAIYTVSTTSDGTAITNSTITNRGQGLTAFTSESAPRISWYLNPFTVPPLTRLYVEGALEIATVQVAGVDTINLRMTNHFQYVTPLQLKGSRVAAVTWQDGYITESMPADGQPANSFDWNNIGYAPNGDLAGVGLWDLAAGTSPRRFHRIDDNEDDCDEVNDTLTINDTTTWQASRVADAPAGTVNGVSIAANPLGAQVNDRNYTVPLEFRAIVPGSGDLIIPAAGRRAAYLATAPDGSPWTPAKFAALQVAVRNTAPGMQTLYQVIAEAVGPGLVRAAPNICFTIPEPTGCRSLHCRGCRSLARHC